jgi:Tol biopolymer transport system component
MRWGEQEDILVVRVDGSESRQLTNDLHKDRAPRWSPNGTEIAFFSDRSGSYEIWTIHRDGSGLRQLTDTPGIATRAPDWSPDGSLMLCYIDEVPHLFDPREVWDRQTPVPLPAKGDDDAWPEIMIWSPDGRWLAGGTVVGQTGGIVLYSLEKEEYRKLTDGGRAPVWTRDARGLLFSTDSGAVHLVDIETEETREILPAGESARYMVVGVSPDARVIYVARGEGEADIWLVTLS